MPAHCSKPSTNLTRAKQCRADAYAQQIENTDPGSPAFNSWIDEGGDQDGACNPDEDLLQCTSDSDCVSILPSRVHLRCVYGVCVVATTPEESCYSHRDCAEIGKLCSGDGMCVDAILQVTHK